MSKKTAMPVKPENHLVVFQEKAIRRTWHNEEWWFSIIDVVGILSETAIALRLTQDEHGAHHRGTRINAETGRKMP